MDKNNFYLGLLNEEDLNNWYETNDKELLRDIKCNDFQHIFDCIEVLVSNNVSCLPVVDDSNHLKGVISLQEVANFAGQLAVTSISGAVFVVEIPSRDYSLVQISQIIESNGAKIIALHTVYLNENSIIRVSIKINTKETTSIMQTFRRYDYNIISHYSGIDTMEQFYHDRIDELLGYINI